MCRYLPNPASLSHEERMSYRSSFAGTMYQGAEPELLNDGSAIYTADDEAWFYLKVFAGKALRPCPRRSGCYRSAERRADAIETFKRGRAAHHTIRALRRLAVQPPHALTVGTILYTSWGYEQTNSEFYQVVAVSGSMVTLREVSASLEETGFMSGRKAALPDQFKGEPIRRRARADNSVKINQCCNAWVWDGRPITVSWYA